MKAACHAFKFFVDSPLSVNATDIFRMHTDSMNKDVKEVMLNDDDPFGFRSLRYIKKVDESNALNDYDRPVLLFLRRAGPRPAV